MPNENPPNPENVVDLSNVPTVRVDEKGNVFVGDNIKSLKAAGHNEVIVNGPRYSVEKDKVNNRKIVSKKGCPNQAIVHSDGTIEYRVAPVDAQQKASLAPMVPLEDGNLINGIFVPNNISPKRERAPKPLKNKPKEAEPTKAPNQKFEQLKAEQAKKNEATVQKIELTEKAEREKGAQAERTKVANQKFEQLKAEQAKKNEATVKKIELKEGIKESLFSKGTFVLAVSGGLIGLGISAAIIGFVWPVAVVAIVSALIFGGIKVAYNSHRKLAQEALAAKDANQQENASVPDPHASTTTIQPRVVPNAIEELLKDKFEARDNKAQGPNRPRGSH
jgi:hypothetical protein